MSSLIERALAFSEEDDHPPLAAGDLERIIETIARVDGYDARFQAYCARTDRRGRRKDHRGRYDSLRTDAEFIDGLRWQHAHFVCGYFVAPKDDARAALYAAELGERHLRRDGGTIDEFGNIDPTDELAARTARGANAAVADPGEMPDVANLDLAATKTVAAALGAYSSGIRPRLAAAVLARLRALGAASVADAFQAAFQAGGISAPSDDESERAARPRARGDELPSETEAAARMRQISIAAWSKPPTVDAAPTSAPSTGAPALDDEATAKRKMRERSINAHRKTPGTAGGDH